MKEKKKKLLILGANPETIPLIEAAHNLGISCVVTDYNPQAPAKQFADISYDVDGMNINGLVELAKKEKVDGVLVGVADALINPYQQVCDILGLPCYATNEQVQCFTNKYKFKRKCEEFGIQGVPEYSVSVIPTEEELEKVSFPVLVKPVDACSGKGITICKKKEELKEAIQYAIQYSFSGIYMVERYMTCADLSIYYTFKDGEIYLSSLSDRYTNKEQGELSPVCLGDIFPSKFIDEFIIREHPKFCKLFRSMGVQNGVLYISAFYENGQCYVYDPGFRLQGGGFHLILNEINGFDHRKMLVNFAVNKIFGEKDFNKKNDPRLQGKSACVLWYMLKSGKISEIKGLDYIRKNPNVFYVIQRFQVGDEITKDMVGTEGQVFLRVFMACENKNKLKRNMKKIKEELCVIDEQGNDMLLSSLDVELV